MSEGLHQTREWVSIRRVLAISLVVGLCSGNIAGAVDVVQITEQVSVDSYTAYLQNDLYTHDGNDRAFSAWHDLARDNIQARFEDFGLTTSLDPFTYSNAEYFNVVGVLPGVTRPEEIYIVGAHYDTVGGSPGAWDNASGVAGLLEAARVLSQYRFEATIAFVAFDREEQGVVGSGAYAGAHAQDDIRGMISLDCIAFRPFQPEDPDYDRVYLWYPSVPTGIVDDLTDALWSYAGLTSMQTQGSGSDHVPFASQGFESALLISWGWKGNAFYHTPFDSVDAPGYIDYEYGTQITRGVVGYLATFCAVSPVWTIPDFNGDWKVDMEDLALLIDHWGQDAPLFDVAPPPAGDGIVDAQDLEGLLHYWEQEISEPGLVAHWTLDETEGTTAHDVAGQYDATILWVAMWQPEGGRVGGALELSGVANLVWTPFVRDPSQGSLSVFAWVKGGAPGQVIVSQKGGGANWLMASVNEGTLETQLRSAGREGSELTCESAITDGNWHRIGLSWDGQTRILYVDDIEVAQDTQDSLASSTGGLYLGAGKGLEPGSFWKGLIDDVRLYDRAVRP